jgi:flagellar biosynthesis GTPase FlhF
MDPLAAFKEYGWAGVVVLFVMYQVWPWFREQISSRWRRKAAETEQARKQAADRALAAIQDEHEQRQSERAERQEERRFRHEDDERRTKAYEDLAGAVQTMARELVSSNERQGEIIRGMTTLSNFMITNVAAMSETVNKMQATMAQQQPMRHLPRIMDPEIPPAREPPKKE